MVATFLLPLAFLYSRAGAEILIGIVDGLFLVRCAMDGGWSWMRAPWVALTAGWWGWTILCSLPLHGAAPIGWHAAVQSLLMGRFFLLAAALANWTLRNGDRRRLLAAMVAAAAAWIALQSWQQYLFGVNVIGARRWGDGALTGPFAHPRAGPALVLILFPSMLIPMAALSRGLGRLPRFGAMAVVLLGTLTMILIGQRMPALLTGLGLLVCAMLLPRLRRVMSVAAVAGIVLLCALPVLSPPTWAKLVVHFSQQMASFTVSSYGLIYTRAAVMALAHPLFGLGFDGFRQGCNDPAYQHGIALLHITDRLAAGPAGCSIHPHNHYLEAATSAGLPGLLLFCVAVSGWLWTLARSVADGANGASHSARVGYFVAVLIGVWPFASTSAFFTLPNAGWMFLMLGMGLAQRGPARQAARTGLSGATAATGPRHGQAELVLR